MKDTHDAKDIQDTQDAQVTHNIKDRTGRIRYKIQDKTYVTHTTHRTQDTPLTKQTLIPAPSS